MIYVYDVSISLLVCLPVVLLEFHHFLALLPRFTIPMPCKVRNADLLFQALAAGVLFLGAWIITAHTKFEHLYDLLNSSVLPACVLLAVGIVLFALGTIGCIGAVREHKCLLGLVRFWREFCISVG